MSMQQHRTWVAIAVASFSLAWVNAPANAQDTAPQAEPVAILKVDAGEVKVSDGGDFLAGATGQPLVEGYRVMLPAEAQARLVYDDQCVVALKQPGVYVVERECKKLAALAPTSNTGLVIGGVVAGALLIGAAAGGGGGSDSPPPPVSR